MIYEDLRETVFSCFGCPFLVFGGWVDLNMKLIDGLALINSTKGGLPEPFSVEFFTLNEAKKTGGQLLKLKNQIGCGSNHNAMEKGTVTVKPVNGVGHPTSIHTRFIEKINGEKVYW